MSNEGIRFHGEPPTHIRQDPRLAGSYKDRLEACLAYHCLAQSQRGTEETGVDTEAHAGAISPPEPGEEGWPDGPWKLGFLGLLGGGVHRAGDVARGYAVYRECC